MKEINPKGITLCVAQPSVGYPFLFLHRDSMFAGNDAKSGACAKR